MKTAGFAAAAAFALAMPAAAQDDGNGPYRQAFEKAMAVVQAQDAEADAEALTLYILGNVTNTMFHEFGHALVSELSIPVLGKEEDAVDALANVIMVAKTDDPALDRMLRAVADDYFANGAFSEQNGDEDEAWGHHSPDKARAYNVICILVGSDADYYKDAADSAGMPEDRQESCAEDYAAALNAWNTLLEPHYLGDGETNAVAMAVTYAEAPESLAFVAELTKASGIVETVVREIDAMVRLPNEIAVSVESCGEENAYWSPDERKVTLCYEIVQSYYNNAARAADQAGGGEAADADDADDTDDEEAGEAE